MVAVVGVLCLSTAGAVAKSCAGGPADSAINQYCESIPTSTGGQAGGSHSSPVAGSTLAGSLPARIIDQLTGTTGPKGAGTSSAASQTGSTSSAATSGTSGHRSGSRRATRSRITADQRRQLLLLPAATVHPTAYRLSSATANVWAPLTWLIAVLAALALALAGVAFAVSRRRPAER